MDSGEMNVTFGYVDNLFNFAFTLMTVVTKLMTGDNKYLYVFAVAVVFIF